MVLHRPHPPVADLLTGQVLEDQLLAAVDVVRLRSGGNGSRAGRGQHDRGHRRGRYVGARPRGRGFGTGLSCGGLPGADLVPLVCAHALAVTS
ncbi:hypothetical protein [Streptomyces sp. NRRL F-5650]|uniref:hypothetical protein n=1 Tax=Streptomyces sp. NRRL F-5650 TaxID=1463868 RepID=UPI0004C98A78|nr:hypothetical protein [Streptomyces sp. NRRL F-5650]